MLFIIFLYSFFFLSSLQMPLRAFSEQQTLPRFMSRWYHQEAYQARHEMFHEWWSRKKLISSTDLLKRCGHWTPRIIKCCFWASLFEWPAILFWIILWLFRNFSNHQNHDMAPPAMSKGGKMPSIKNEKKKKNTKMLLKSVWNIIFHLIVSNIIIS